MFTEILAVASGPHPFWDPARAPVHARHRATVAGRVTFELPPGVTVASVKWSAGLDRAAATWTVSK